MEFGHNPPHRFVERNEVKYYDKQYTVWYRIRNNKLKGKTVAATEPSM